MGFFTPNLKPADWRAILVKASHRGIHNFSFGCCTAYFGLLSGGAEWIDACVLHISNRGKHKTWVFESGCPDREQLLSLQQLGPVYSQVDIGLPARSSFKEVTYDLEVAFNPASYPDRKKRYQRLRYPPRWMEKYGFEVGTLDRADLTEVEELHSEWVAHKLAQEGTYQIMFPRKRYLECCRLAVEYPDWFVGYKITERAIAGVRILYREGEWAFDLAQFAQPLGLPGSASEHFAHATMSALRDDGVRWLNCGASLNRSLAGFKHHWPHQIISHFSYSQLKK